MRIFKLFIDREWRGDFPTLEFAQTEGKGAARAGHFVHIEPDEVPAFLKIVPHEGWRYDLASDRWTSLPLPL